ncbi:DUF2798 domain-containing protein [Methylophilus luteus]|uniref:DUF2798 domain-containing protein n=1 Tax=Methylophilus luteus TaxID=640108 RepID=A0ABW3F6Y2_9PROT
MVSSSKSRLALKRQLLFALLMSLVTVNIVSIAILLIHGVPLALLFEKWLTSIVVAWPIVFISILLVAPWLLRLTERLVKDHDQP